MGLDAASQGISPFWAFIKTGGALAFLAGCYLIVLHFFRKKTISLPWLSPNEGRKKKAIEIAETKFLGGKSHLCLVNVHSSTLLLGISPQGITCLKEFPIEAPSATNFKDHLPK